MQNIAPDIESKPKETVGSEESTVAETEQKQISIQIGDLTLTGELNDSVLADELASLLPQTISMQRIGGGREFYGSLDGNLNYDKSDAQTTFENGDIAYWFSGIGLFCNLQGKSKKSQKIFQNFPVCTPEMCSGYVRRRKRTSSNIKVQRHKSFH